MAAGSVFLSILLLSFAACTLVAGLFAAYFGMGKSRTIGLTLMVVALLAGLAWVALVWPLLPGVEPVWEPGVVGTAVAAVLGAGVGAVASLMLFLGSIMKA